MKAEASCTHNALWTCTIGLSFILFYFETQREIHFLSCWNIAIIWRILSAKIGLHFYQGVEILQIHETKTADELITGCKAVKKVKQDVWENSRSGRGVFPLQWHCHQRQVSHQRTIPQTKYLRTSENQGLWNLQTTQLQLSVTEYESSEGLGRPRIPMARFRQVSNLGLVLLLIVGVRFRLVSIILSPNGFMRYASRGEFSSSGRS